MKTIQSVEKTTGKIGSAIGRGLIAGLAGTAAITLSQWLENKINRKDLSFAPADAACKALGIEASEREQREKLSREVHWTYGTLWGVPLGLISLTGISKLPAAAIHFGAIFYTALTIQPDFEVSPPVQEWSKKKIAIDALHHAVYIAVAGLVFDAINKESTK
jgi:hypothetical protein